MTLDESRNTETDRAKLRDTLEGMHDPKGINIHEDTLEESKTDTTKGPNNVDSKGLNYQNCKKRTYINKQSPNLTEDATDGVYVNRVDLDDLVVQVPEVQGVRQSAGTLQPDESSLRMTCQVESQRVGNVFNRGHSFGTYQENTALPFKTRKALTLSIINETAHVPP